MQSNYSQTIENAVKTSLQFKIQIKTLVHSKIVLSALQIGEDVGAKNRSSTAPSSALREMLPERSLKVFQLRKPNEE